MDARVCRDRTRHSSFAEAIELGLVENLVEPLVERDDRAPSATRRRTTASSCRSRFFRVPIAIVRL